MSGFADQDHVVQREVQFRKYEFKANDEVNALQREYSDSAASDDKYFVLFVVLAVSLICLSSILVIFGIGPCINWVGAAGAFTTLAGIYLQIHYLNQSNIVTNFSDITQELEVRFAIYYAFCCVASLQIDAKIVQSEQDAIMDDLYENNKSEVFRAIRKSIQQKQSTAAYVFIFSGTVISAFSWRTC